MYTIVIVHTSYRQYYVHVQVIHVHMHACFTHGECIGVRCKYFGLWYTICFLVLDRLVVFNGPLFRLTKNMYNMYSFLSLSLSLSLSLPPSLLTVLLMTELLFNQNKVTFRNHQQSSEVSALLRQCIAVNHSSWLSLPCMYMYPISCFVYMCLHPIAKLPEWFEIPLVITVNYQHM